MAEHAARIEPDQTAAVRGPAQGWRAWFSTTDPTVLAEQLSVSYGNYVFNSAVAIFIVLYLYFSSAIFFDSRLVDGWVTVFCLYLFARIISGLLYPHRKKIAEASLRRWDRLLLWTQAGYGGMLVVLAIGIFPALDAFAQSVVLTGSLVLLGSTAFSFSGHIKAMALTAPAPYLAFAWSAWNLSSPYAGGLTVLILSLLGLYVIYALKNRRSLERGFALAVQNRELAQELQLKNEQLQEVAAARGRLLATVSHDLRQPAHAIGLLTDRALMEPAAGPVRPLLTDLQQLSQSLSTSLSTLMDLTRLDAGMTQAHIEAIPLRAVLERIRVEYALMADAKGLVLQVEETSAWVSSDPVLLHAVIANLLANALKYTRQGQVMVRVSEQGDEIRIEVSDTGVGMEAGQLDVIFKEFVRLDASKPGTEGLGLGLSIVRRYVALLGHRIEVSSQLGQGSRFVVVMQRAQPKVQAVVAAPICDEERLQGLRVLVVDNVPLIVTSMARALSAMGCRVVTAESLKQAVAVDDIDLIDVVITDFHLGDREPDGLAVVQALQAMRSKPLAALIMTGDVSPELEGRAAASGVWIEHKPVRPKVLGRRLLEILDAH
jgi:signal transduction histidine kinase